jgi:hypothetical protein
LLNNKAKIVMLMCRTTATSPFQAASTVKTGVSLCESNHCLGRSKIKHSPSANKFARSAIKFVRSTNKFVRRGINVARSANKFARSGINVVRSAIRFAR